MLFSPVYIETHLRRIAVHAASRTSSISSNSIGFYCFRTLASHFQTSVSSNSSVIKRFRTLCKIPGIGYPLLVTPHSPLFIHPLCFQRFPDSCCTMERRNPCVFRRLRTLSIAMGVYTPLPRAFFAKGPFHRALIVAASGAGEFRLPRTSRGPGWTNSSLSPACPELVAAGGITSHQSPVTTFLPRHFVSATVTAAGGFFYVSQ
jgi:hypothetical protein